MKRAWLVWDWDSTDDETPVVMFHEPDGYYRKVVAIVYAEIVE